MGKPTTRSLLSLACCLPLLVLACSGKTASGTGSDDGGPCDQTCMDTHTGVALVQLVDQIYNGNVNGKPVGTQSGTATCPMGGNAVISGSTSLDMATMITSVNLTYVMSGCELTDNGDTLTFAGTVTEVGAYDSASEETLQFSSNALQFTGTVSGTAVDVPGCPVQASDMWTANPQIAGSICNRSF
jgi:hypothetical protein